MNSLTIFYKVVWVKSLTAFLDATNTVYDLTLKQLSLEGLELDPATLALDRERLNAQLVGAVFDDVILT